MPFFDVTESLTDFVTAITSYWTTEYPTIFTLEDTTDEGYVLHYITDDVYFLIEHGLIYSQEAYRCLGIKFTVGEGWDGGALTGSTSADYMRFMSSTNTSNTLELDTEGERTAASAAMSLEFKYWQDQYGITLVTRPISGFTSGLRTHAIMWNLSLTPSTNWEVDDGGLGIFSHHIDSYDLAASSLYDCRPFTSANTIGNVSRSTQSLVPELRSAYKSMANNKVYFNFSYMHAKRISTDLPYDAYVYPILRSKRWFPVDKTGGLAVGDIISWIDPDTLTVRKYAVCEVKDLSNGTTTSYYAIPYENGAPY